MSCPTSPNARLIFQGRYLGRCDCGAPATYQVPIELGCYDAYTGRTTLTPATLFLCDRCWQLEQDQAAAALGRGEWSLSGVAR